MQGELTNAEEPPVGSLGLVEQPSRCFILEIVIWCHELATQEVSRDLLLRVSRNHVGLAILLIAMHHLHMLRLLYFGNMMDGHALRNNRGGLGDGNMGDR